MCSANLVIHKSSEEPRGFHEIEDAISEKNTQFTSSTMDYIFPIHMNISQLRIPKLLLAKERYRLYQN